MTSLELGVRFTDKKYATKNEVRNELQTPLVDSFWKAISDYRSQFDISLPLNSIEKNTFRFCNNVLVSNKIDEIKNLFKENNKYISHLVDKKARIKALPPFSSLKNNQEYVNVLSFSFDIRGEEINKELVQRIYERFFPKGIENLYRIHDGKASFIIDKVYDGAPSNRIEAMMDSLFSFIKNDDIDPIIRAIGTFFYILYVKPFDSFNEEMAVILTKLVFYKQGYENSEYYAFESMFIMDKAENNKVMSETQKTDDLTYFAIKVLDVFTKEIQLLIDDGIKAETLAMKEEYNKSKVDVLKPVNEKEEVKQEHIEKPHNPINEIRKETIPHNAENRLAIASLPNRLDEDEALEMEENLLELDPFLKKGQAKFYVRHCTIGKRYTIQQYKKFIGCVYETARTSMDSLVELGYYKQEMVKNKKVYTPIDKTMK